MGEGLNVVQKAYEAFARRDIPALLNLVADEVDWKVVGPASLPHCSPRRNPAEVADFFIDLGSVEDLTVSAENARDDPAASGHAPRRRNGHW